MATTVSKRIAKVRASDITPDMSLTYLVALWVVGLLIVLDALITWFWSEFPAHVFRLLWKMGWKRDEPGFWPEEVESYELWNRDVWSVWINIKMPARGELLTCPVCLGRHLSWLVALVLLPFAGFAAWPALLAGCVTWSGLANRIIK